MTDNEELDNRKPPPPLSVEANSPASSFRDEKRRIMEQHENERGFRDEKQNIVATVMMQKAEVPEENTPALSTNQRRKGAAANDLSAGRVGAYQSSRRAIGQRPAWSNATNRLPTTPPLTATVMSSSARSVRSTDASNVVFVAAPEEAFDPGPGVSSTDHQATTLNPDFPADQTRSSTPSEDKKRFVKIAIILILVLAIALGVGLGVGLSNNNNNNSNNNGGNPTTPENDDNSLPCDIDTILTECSYDLQEPGNPNNDNNIKLTSIGNDCIMKYNDFKNDWLLRGYSFQYETTSCHPVNLAFWALVTDSEDVTSSTESRLQRFVLKILFYSTFGRRWIGRGNWTSTTASECDWFGVRCNNITLEVDGLFLLQNFLEGTIPSELALLTSLETINLGRNFLSGTIPEDFAVQTRLSVFDVGSNVLSGTLPTELFVSFPSLETFFIHRNKFAGTIPTEVGLLSFLEVFGAADNLLVGTIPAELGDCRNMTFLLLRANMLTGGLPSELGQLQKLEVLDLSQSNLDIGQLPSWLWNLTSMEQLGLWECRVTGTFPREVGLFNNLTLLDLNDNRLAGPLPSELGLLTRMRRFYIRDNMLTSTIPTDLGLCTDLTVLNLEGNEFTGNLPTELGLLVDLVLLFFGNNRLRGVIPQEVCGLWDWNLTFFGRNSCVNPYGGLSCPDEDCCRNCPHFA